MRLVIDTNILVSALVFGASAKACLDLIAHHPKITLLVSAPVAREYLAVLQREKFAQYQSLVALNQRLDDYLESCALVEPQIEIEQCRGPHDDMFLELAVAGKAQVILSGDQDLLALNPFEGIEILSLSVFEAKYLEQV